MPDFCFRNSKTIVRSDAPWILLGRIDLFQETLDFEPFFVNILPTKLTAVERSYETVWPILKPRKPNERNHPSRTLRLV